MNELIHEAIAMLERKLEDQRKLIELRREIDIGLTALTEGKSSVLTPEKLEEIRDWGHQSSGSHWPTFESEYLMEIASAFLLRRKAISYHHKLLVEREFEENFERMDILIAQMKISIWSDGLCWLGITVKAKGQNSGWAFKDTFHGNVLNLSATSIVEMVEATIGMSHTFGKDPVAETAQLRKLWESIHPYPS